MCLAHESGPRSWWAWSEGQHPAGGQEGVDNRNCARLLTRVPAAARTALSGGCCWCATASTASTSFDEWNFTRSWCQSHPSCQVFRRGESRHVTTGLGYERLRSHQPHPGDGLQQSIWLPFRGLHDLGIQRCQCGLYVTQRASTGNQRRVVIIGPADHRLDQVKDSSTATLTVSVDVVAVGPAVATSFTAATRAYPLRWWGGYSG